MHTSHDHTLREIVWQRERKHPAYKTSVYVWGHTVLHSSTPIMSHGCVAWFTVHRKPHWFSLLKVCGFTPAFLKETWTHTQHQLSNEALGQESFALWQTAHIFLSLLCLYLCLHLSLALSLSPFFLCSFSISLGCYNWERLRDVWVTLQTYMPVRKTWIDVRQSHQNNHI